MQPIGPGTSGLVDADLWEVAVAGLPPGCAFVAQISARIGAQHGFRPHGAFLLVQVHLHMPGLGLRGCSLPVSHSDGLGIPVQSMTRGAR